MRVFKNRVVQLLSLVTLFGGGAARAYTNSYVTTYSNFSFPSGTFYNVDIEVRVDVDPGTSAARFFSHEFGFADGSPGYIGIQAVDPKTALFSLWNATSASAGDAGTYCVPFANEGSGWSCRVNYDWRAGVVYRLRVWAFSQTSWGGWIKDTSTGAETFLGTINTPPSGGWLSGGSTTFTEYFGPDFAQCSDLKDSQVTWFNPTANNGGIASTWAANSIGSGACPAVRSSTGQGPTVQVIGAQGGTGCQGGPSPMTFAALLVLVPLWKLRARRASS